jgi:hypothetical protein
MQMISWGTWQLRPSTHFEQFLAQRRPHLLAITTAGCHVGSFDEAAPTVQRTVLPSSPTVKLTRSYGGALVLSFETSGKTRPATQRHIKEDVKLR